MGNPTETKPKPGPTQRRRNRELAAANRPTAAESALIEARAALIAAGQPPILESLSKRLGVSKPVVCGRRKRCVEKGLIPEREALEHASERSRQVAAQRMAVLECARALAGPDEALEPLAVAKHLGLPFDATLRRIRELKMAGLWRWSRPPRPKPARAVVEAANPLDRINPPAEVIAQVDAARRAVTLDSPSRVPPGGARRTVSQVRRSIDLDHCEVADMVREWKRRKRRARHARQA